MTSPASTDAVSNALRKVLTNASLQRIPRHPVRRDIVLAILSLRMRRRHAYSEPQLNEILNDALTGLNAKVDHVTCRRYMVDLGFVKRDRAGARYFLNYPKLESTLSAEAIASARILVAEVLTHQKTAQGGRVPMRRTCR